MKVTLYTTGDGTFPIHTLFDNWREVYSGEDAQELISMVDSCDPGYVYEEIPGFEILFHN